MIVICVEDSLLTVCALQQTTQQIAPDARVFACLTVAEAVETARENGCDVLLTEIDMGKNGTGGIELARQIIRASGYVRKPFSAAELKKEFDNLRYSVK